MLVKHLFFALMPALVFSAITITIKAGKRKNHVQLKGSEVNAISDVERKTFKIDDENLRRVATEFYGKSCDKAYVRPPTISGDIYKDYNLGIIERHLTPKKAIILGVDAKPVAVNTVDYINYSNHNATYNTMVTQTVEESVSRAISKGGELSIGQEINYSVDFGIGSVGGSTSLSYTANWNEEVTKTRSTTIGSSSGVTVTIPPRSKVAAVLTATQGKMNIEINYVAKLDGFIYCYNKGGDNYAIAIDRLQSARNLTQYFYYTERIQVGFYANVRVELKDSKYTESEESEESEEINCGRFKEEGSILKEGAQRTKYGK